MARSLISFALMLLAAPIVVFGGPLQEASVNQIVNDVKVIDPHRGARHAVLKETINGDLGVATGAQSRAELLFQDNTLTRLGAESFFTFKPGTRDLNLEKGTMLLQVPKGLGGARIRAGSATASVTGTTIMLENLPQKRVKVLVLEGSLKFALNGNATESVVLTAGRMVVVGPHAKHLPGPVTVDLQKMVKLSSLIDPRGFKGKSDAAPAPLPSMRLIKMEIGRQEAQHLDHEPAVGNRLISTNPADSNAKAQQLAQSTQSATANHQSTSADSSEKRAADAGGTLEEQKKAAEKMKAAGKKAAEEQKKAAKKAAEEQQKADEKAREAAKKSPHGKK